MSAHTYMYSPFRSVSQQVSRRSRESSLQSNITTTPAVVRTSFTGEVPPKICVICPSHSNSETTPYMSPPRRLGISLTGSPIAEDTESRCHLCNRLKMRKMKTNTPVQTDSPYSDYDGKDAEAKETKPPKRLKAHMKKSALAGIKKVSRVSQMSQIWMPRGRATFGAAPHCHLDTLPSITRSTVSMRVSQQVINSTITTTESVLLKLLALLLLFGVLVVPSMVSMVTGQYSHVTILMQAITLLWYTLLPYVYVMMGCATVLHQGRAGHLPGGQ